ncbi:hypothetical protein GOODEAATRI_023965 [Goodea atripinnis]|uniref:Uncharacterized protein n=1 Tax=Goodea atripinnis TaxID=208336 RepID=A0ABV0ND54_9TELE
MQKTPPQKIQTKVVHGPRRLVSSSASTKSYFQNSFTSTAPYSIRTVWNHPRDLMGIPGADFGNHCTETTGKTPLSNLPKANVVQRKKSDKVRLVKLPQN